MLPVQKPQRMDGTYPVTGVLGDVFTNLLGRQTERTDLGSQSRLGSDLTTSHSQVTIDRLASCFWQPLRLMIENLHDLHLIGVELGSCPTGVQLVASHR